MLQNRLRDLRIRLDDTLRIGERVEEKVRLDLRLQQGELRGGLRLERLGGPAALVLEIGAIGFRAPVEHQKRGRTGCNDEAPRQYAPLVSGVASHSGDQV